MLKPIVKSFRHLLTAIMLFVVLLIGAEGFLQWQGQHDARLVCDHVCSTHQALLVPSPTIHHDNPRLETVVIEEVQYRFDAAGFRIAAEVGENASAGQGLAGPQSVSTTSGNSSQEAIRIVLLGDERFFGIGLQDEDCLGARLQWFLNSDPQTRVEVINAAVPGYCPLLSFLKYRQDVAALQPDLVILHVDYSDVADDIQCRRYLKRQPDSGAVCTHPDLKHNHRQKNRLVDLMSQSKLVQRAKGQVTESERSARVRRIAEQYRWILEPQVSPSHAVQIRHAMRPIAELAEEIEEQGGVLVLSSSPLPWQSGTPSNFPELASILPETVWKQPNQAAELLAAMAVKLQAPFCETTTAFSGFSQPDRLYQPNSLELSRIGALLYAKELAGFVWNLDEYQQLKQSRSELAKGIRQPAR